MDGGLARLEQNVVRVVSLTARFRTPGAVARWRSEVRAQIEAGIDINMF